MYAMHDSMVEMGQQYDTSLYIRSYRMGGNFRGVKILGYFEEAIILNFRGC